LENDRPGPSYTADTLQILRDRHPGAELFLIIGGDSLHDLPHWYQTPRILELATLLVTARPGWQPLSEAEVRGLLGLAVEHPVRVRTVPVPLIEIASRDLRRRFAEGRSVRYQVPRAVEAYVRDKGLYQAGGTPANDASPAG
jgi:nicotinate-nucleotide adenylyltransferase